MTDEEIESYYGAVKCEQIKMFALDRKIYPYRKVPVLKIEDLLYAMQNTRARELILGIVQRGKIEFQFDAKTPINTLSLNYRDATQYAENLLRRTNTWIVPDKEIETGKYIEVTGHLEEALKSRGYFIDVEELEPRPAIYIQDILYAKQVAWMNKSFEQMTTAFLNPTWNIDGTISCQVHTENSDGQKTDYRYGYIVEWHSQFSRELEPDDWEDSVPDLGNVKLSYFDSERGEEAFASQKRMIVEDGSSQYHGDWIDKTYMAVLYHAHYQNQKTSGEIINKSKRYLRIDETDVFTPSLAVSAFNHAKSDLGYSSAVHNESKIISVSVLQTCAIVMLKKENLMITEE